MSVQPRFSDAEQMQMMREYYENGLTYTQLAEKYDAPITTIQRCLERPRINERYRAEVARKKAKAEIRAAIAAIRAADVSPQMMEQIIEIASQKVSETPIQYQYAIHNAASDVLNRAGVKAQPEESKEVRIILESGIDLGEPDSVDERSD